MYCWSSTELTVPLNQRCRVTTQTICSGSLSLEWYWLQLLKLVQESLQTAYCWSSTELDCNSKPADAVTTTALEAFSWNGTDYTTTPSWYKNPSKRMYCWSSTELDCYP
jgi:hypothetical protein